MKRTYPSGHQKRLKKQKVAEEDERLRGSLSAFLVPQPQPVHSEIDDGPSDSEIILIPDASTDAPTIGSSEATSSSKLFSISDTDRVDPNNWPVVLSDKVKNEIVDAGPHQITDFPFPKALSGRAFHKSLYSKRLANGELVSRPWLIYSKSADSVFCFCCSIFNRNANTLSRVPGYSDWSNVSKMLSEHESFHSISHLEAVFTQS